jgi:hypothetical protein
MRTVNAPLCAITNFLAGDGFSVFYFIAPE